MNRIIFTSLLVILTIIILGGLWWLNIRTSENQQVTDLLTRIEALEKEVQISFLLG